jgi:hypothetical protein
MTGQGAPDRVFNVTAHATGTLTASISSASFDVLLWASTTCTNANASLACAVPADGGSRTTLSFPVEEGKNYYVFVDGAAVGSESTPEGTFRITFSID